MSRRDVTLDDRVWKKLLAKLPGIDRTHVKVGVLASKGGTETQDGITMVELAAIHEFGAPAAGIPERSFIRRTFRIKRTEMATIVSHLARKLLSTKMKVVDAMGLLGAWGAAEVKKTITEGEGIPPPLLPATIARKKSSRPLVDTGRLLGSITWEVSEGE